MKRHARRRTKNQERLMRFFYIYVTDDGKTSPAFGVEANNLGHALQKLAAMFTDEVSVQVWKASDDPSRTATVHRIGKKPKPTHVTIPSNRR